jgi:hypothetical protein
VQPITANLSHCLLVDLDLDLHLDVDFDTNVLILETLSLGYIQRDRNGCTAELIRQSCLARR